MRTYIRFMIIVLFTACSPTSTPLSMPSEVQPVLNTPEGEIPTMTPIPSLPHNPNLQSLVKNARADLAHRLNIPESEISVLEARDVVWPDSSMGCPQPGMLYTEVLTPGYLILLEANGQKYEYHAGKSSDIFLCEDPTPPIPGMSGDT